jgi:hypothetical protein
MLVSFGTSENCLNERQENDQAVGRNTQLRIPPGLGDGGPEKARDNACNLRPKRSAEYAIGLFRPTVFVRVRLAGLA